jgi:hypothetical protein
MAQFRYRANLSAKVFPFLSDNWGQTVIVPQYDNTAARGLTSSEDADQEAGIPQVYYCHNVMPNAQGFQSVGYDVLIGAQTPLIDIRQIFVLRDGAGNRIYFAVSTGGYYSTNAGSVWSPARLIGSIEVPDPIVTVAYVAGASYVYLAGQGCYVYNFTTNQLDSVTLTGLDTVKTQGIVSTSGYLVAWMAPTAGKTFTITTLINTPGGSVNSIDGLVLNQVISAPGIFPPGTTIIGLKPADVPLPGDPPTITTDQDALATVTSQSITTLSQASGIAWSSTIDPTDFLPSTVTGAGGGQIEQAKGNIVTCVASPTGFVVFTPQNAVSAVYTNNSRYPFNFREVLGSSGIESIDEVAYAANGNLVYAYTSSGVQAIGTQQAQTILPDVTDFLSGQVFEDFDETSSQFTRTILNTELKKRITVISDRYLIFSYGITTYTHALVFDMAQKRFGKLKKTHATLLEYENIANTPIEISKNSIALVTNRGEFNVVNFTPRPTGNSFGVILLGKYQYVRPRLLQLDEITVENVINTSTFVCKILSSFDGKNTFINTVDILESEGKLIHYGCRALGTNHSLLLMGNFTLNTIVLNFNTCSKR